MSLERDCVVSGRVVSQLSAICCDSDGVTEDSPLHLTGQ